MTGTLTRKQIEDTLQSNALGRIGCRDKDHIYIVPVNYVYDGSSIIAHSATGMKINMMRKNPYVGFEVDEIKDFNNWKSVIARGLYQELTDEKEKYEAMQLFVNRMLRLKISETAVPPEISEKRVHPRSPGNIQLVIYRIILTEKTGRFETS